jgi:putative FmdB family regulatory protein
MPVYEYRCDECGKEFEEVISIVSMGDTKPACPQCCSKTTTRIIRTAPAVKFVGKGFYINDSKKK